MGETRTAPAVDSAPPQVPAPDGAPVGAGSPAPRGVAVRGGAGRSLRYRAEGRRDLRLDFLRGFCAFAMVVDHVGGASYLYPITGGNRFFVSAAEGFIFLSGLLVGLIYGPRVLRDGLAPVQLHLLKRALTLYAVTLGLTFAFVGLSRLAEMPWLQDVEPLTPQLVAGIVTLHHTYYLVDVMLLYTLLLVVSPLALLLLTSGHTGAVLLLSGGLWLLQQWFPEQALVPWPVVNNDTFAVAAWQVWYFGGMVVGYHRGRIWRALGRIPTVPAALVLFGLAALLVALAVDDGRSLGGLAPQFGGVAPLEGLFGKEQARPGRLAAFAVFFSLFYLLLTYAWRPLQALLGWLLVPYGQNALYVYAVHLFAVYLAALLLPYVAGYDRFDPAHNTPVQLLAVLGIWVLVKRGVLFDVIPR